MIFFICLSLQLGGGSMPCDLSSLMHLRNVIDYHFVQLFSCCENGSYDFQALYILEMKPKVSLLSLCLSLSPLPSSLSLSLPPSLPSFLLM